MQAYVDLSIIVFICNFLLSFFYSMVLFDYRKYNIGFIIVTIMISIFICIINLFFIPYFFIFSFILYSLFMAIFDIKILKTMISTLFLYYFNCSLMLLIGGCYLYDGILLINIPFISLFVFIQPIYVCLMHLIFTLLIKYIKEKSFIYKCFIEVNELIYKGKGYYDSGNMLTYNDLPVIFLKGNYHNSDGEVIHIKGINDETYTYLAFKGVLKINKKIRNVYVVFVNDNLNFNNCNILLNKYIL